MRKLTAFEKEALDGPLNVSDGHPRMPATPGQRAALDRLPQLYDEALRRTFDEIEHEAHRTFLHGLGQQCAPIGTGRILSCYSSSVAMDLVARALAQRTRDVALVHPTFDNIPDLLRARGLRLLPLSEHQLETGQLELPPHVGAVFVTTPNNPTGWVLPEPALRRLATFCARTGRVLALDTCFRGYDRAAQYDCYRLLDDTGVEWVVIEDTGKLWPMLELKAGFLAFSEQSTLPLVEAFDDVLLSISPVVLRLLTAVAADAAAGGYAELQALVAQNRRSLQEIISPSGGQLTDPFSRISVARVTIPPWATALEVFDALRANGVHTLPCDAFHWADPGAGASQLRIALAREPRQLRAAASELAAAIAERPRYGSSESAAAVGEWQ